MKDKLFIKKESVLTPLEQAKRYVDACGESISGNRGGGQTIGVLCHLFKDFEEDVAQQAADYYNETKCSPMWKGNEWKHKLNDARKKVKGNRYFPTSVTSETTKTSESVLKNMRIENKYNFNDFTDDYSVEEFLNVVHKNNNVLICYPDANKKPKEIQVYIPGHTKVETDREYGTWISLNGVSNNPVNEKNEISLSNDNTIKYEYCLIDFDSNTKDVQINLVKQINLPCAAIIDSGIRGLHCWVKVNAQNEEDFKIKTQQLQDLLEPMVQNYKIKLDSSVTTRLAGWARLAGCYRGDVKQRCIYLNENPQPFDEWFDNIKNPGALSILDKKLLWSPEPIVDPACEPIVGPYIANQSLLSLCSQTGLGKSVLSIQWAVCLAVGKPLMNLEFLKTKTPLRVLNVQAEDNAEKIRQIVWSTVEQMQLTDADRILFENNFTSTSPITFGGMPTFFKAFENYLNTYKPNFVFLNPLNRYFSGDFVSDHEKISTFINQLNSMAQQYNCSICIITHTAKPSEEEGHVANIYDETYAIFGSSLWASALRNMILLKKINGNDRQRQLMFCKGFEDIVKESRTKILGMAEPPTKFYTLVGDKRHFDYCEAIVDVLPVSISEALTNNIIKDKMEARYSYENISMDTLKKKLKELEDSKRIKSTTGGYNNKTKLYYKDSLFFKK
jgi:hypothetical protein